jgi:hypothetical protein
MRCPVYRIPISEAHLSARTVGWAFYYAFCFFHQKSHPVGWQEKNKEKLRSKDKKLNMRFFLFNQLTQSVE